MLYPISFKKIKEKNGFFHLIIVISDTQFVGIDTK
jgi:hypothetical protein